MWWISTNHIASCHVLSQVSSHPLRFWNCLYLEVIEKNTRDMLKSACPPACCRPPSKHNTCRLLYEPCLIIFEMHRKKKKKRKIKINLNTFSLDSLLVPQTYLALNKRVRLHTQKLCGNKPGVCQLLPVFCTLYTANADNPSPSVLVSHTQRY